MSATQVCKTDKYSVVEVGTFSDLDKYEHGKAFLKDVTGSSSMEISITKYKPGDSIPIFHDHKNHEEVYIVISGEGEFQLDDKVFKIKEGSVVRVCPGVSRNLKNTGSVDMVVVCAQAEMNSLKSPIGEDFFMTQTQPKFSK